MKSQYSLKSIISKQSYIYVLKVHAWESCQSCSHDEKKIILISIGV